MASTSAFPVQGLLPKQETKAANLLLKHPHYDGRNTIIAILDTGVDPTAPGLQVTSFNNMPKLIDVIDCTGSGDVEMSDLVKPTKDNCLVGCTGRSLKLNPAWTNPTAQFRVGMISGFQLFGPVQARVSEARKNEFLIRHRKLQADLKSAATDLKDEYETRLTALQSLLDQFQDVGPVYDVVLFHDGDHYRVIVDTSETGDLASQPVLASYRFFRQSHRFGSLDNLCFSVNVYDDGKLVSLVTVAGSHGTHVASICAKYDPNDASQNGIAPGAQLVSLKIGDSRLGSMETGAGLSRAILCMVQNKVDVANMSYGEAVSCANTGRFVDLLRDVCVFQFKIVFVSSAGNAGPALSTIGAPGGTTEGVISVGAHVSRNQIVAEYALVNDHHINEQLYTWSSRGPTYDGDFGVDVVAPGSAITSVPSCTLSCAQLMNGTSMSSPNACGNIALLVSAWKAAGVPNHRINSFRILRALQNTGIPVDSDPFNRPFIQVDKALEYLLENQHDFKQDIHFRLSMGLRNQRGVYLRDPQETHCLYSGTVNVKPIFHTPVGNAHEVLNEAYMADKIPGLPQVLDSEIDAINQLKLALDLRLVLVPSHPWIRVPMYVQMTSEGRNIPIEVDSHLLPTGLHVGKVEAFDADNTKHPMFTIPVTIAKPMHVDQNTVCFKKVHMSGGSIERRFIAVPLGATHVDLSVQSSPHCSQAVLPKSNTPAILLVRTLQLCAGQRYTDHDVTNRFQLRPDSCEIYNLKRIKVVPGVTMELVLAQWWAGIGEYEVDVDLVFHGIHVLNPLVQGDAVNQLDVGSLLGREDNVNLLLSVDQYRKFYRPESCVISALSSTRDILPNTCQVYQLVQTYVVKSPESGPVSLLYPGLGNHLYECPYDAYLIMLHDAAGRLLATHDIYANKPFKFGKGAQYIIRTQIRHDLISVLEKLKDMPLAVDFPAPKDQVGVDLFTSYADAVMRTKPIAAGEMQLQKAKYRAMFALVPSEIKETSPGDLLLVKVNLAQPGKPKLVLSTVAIPVTNGPVCSAESATDGNDQVLLADKIRDLKIAHLKTLKQDPKQANELIAELSKTCDKHIPYLHVKLELMPNQPSEAVAALANKVIAEINPSKLLVDLTALSVDEPDKEKALVQKKRKKELDATKATLLLALQKRAHALLAMHEATDPVVASGVSEYMQWLGDGALTLDAVEVLVASKTKTGHLGSALTDVCRFIKETPMTKDNVEDIKKAYGLQLELLKTLKWDVYAENEAKWAGGVRFPKSCAPF